MLIIFYNKKLILLKNIFMSKSPISFTPEASPISSPLTPKTFDFSPSSVQKATDEFEQQGEIAQQRALTKEEEEEKLLKQAALDKLETEQDVLYQCYKDYATPSTCLSL